MDPLYLLIVTLIIGFAVIIYLIQRKPSNTTDQHLVEWLKSMQSSIDHNNKTIHSTLTDSTKALNERLDNAAHVIASVQKNIGEMSEIGRSMRDLQDFLKSPKLRGNIGEHVLKELLGQMLPKQSFHLQYAYKSGSIVDAVIKTEAGIIPIDSKFPMENFRKFTSSESDQEKKSAEKAFTSDVKKHIDSIAHKYIATHEGTIDYALMYVPSEAVYYEIVNNPLLFDYSSQKRVLPVSPMTFYAYLRAILMGFEGQKISKKAREMLASIRAVQKEYDKVGENLDTLTRHINNSHNMLSQINNGFSRLGQQITNSQQLGEEEKDVIDKPKKMPSIEE